MDEGVGVYSSRFLKENYLFTPPVEIVDGGTLGFKLMEYFDEYDRVILLDTISINDKPGSIYAIPAEALRGLSEYKQTVHEVEVMGMIELSALHDSIAEVSVMGIIPEDIRSVKMDLSPRIKKEMPQFIEKILQEINNAGIKAEKIPVQKDIEEIISLYTNHTQGLSV